MARIGIDVDIHFTGPEDEIATGTLLREAFDSVDPELAGFGEIWNFQLGGGGLNPRHVRMLKTCAEFLNDNRDVFCRIVGLASRSGADDLNLNLSTVRARNTHGHLVDIEGVDVEQTRHQSGSLFLPLGEDAWRILGVADGRRSERAEHRAVVLMMWKNHHPTLAQEMKTLRQILVRRSGGVLNGR